MQNESLSTVEAARELGLAVRSVQLMVDRGDLQAWKTPGGHRRISVDSVRRWLSTRSGTLASTVTAPRKPVVLLIEDSRHFQNLVRLLVEQHQPGVDLHIADDGVAGLVQCGQLQPDVLLIDILLPGIDGATLITSAMAKPYFERVFANPNAVAPDRLAASGRSARILGVDGRMALNDGPRRIEIHEMQGSVHAQGFMLVYLPNERLLIEADAYTPGPPNSPPPPVVNANAKNLVDNIDRLGLQVDRILPLHSRIATMAELNAQVGR